MPISCKENLICPVCHHTEFDLYLTCRDALVSGKQFELVRCSHCSMVQTLSPPPSDQIGEYYKSDSYISHSDTRKTLMDRLYHIARSYMLKQKWQWIVRAMGKKPQTLLDVGTGTGYFPAFAKDRGCAVWAVEQDANARNMVQKNRGIETYSSLSEVLLSDHSVELITLWHVLEHLPDLDQQILTIDRLLHPSGWLVLALPNIQSWDALHYVQDWAGYDVPRHLWHFSPATIEQLMKKYGFCLSHSLPMPLDGVYISLLSEKNRGIRGAYARGGWWGVRSFMAALRRSDQASSMVYFFRKE